MRGRWALAAAAALAVAAPPPAGAATPRPDLTVASAKVSLTGTGLTGSFTVRVTRRAVGTSSASLGIRVAGRRVPVARFTVGALRRGASRRVTVRGGLPAGLPVGRHLVTACADSGHRIKEHAEANNCRAAVEVQVGRPSPVPPTTSPTPGPQPPPVPGATPAGPPPPSATASTVPPDPVPFQKDAVFRLEGPSAPYWVYVPAGYDASHATPTTLFVWLHGCGERSPEKILGPSPGGAQSWITIAPGGRESDCWEPRTDSPLVLSAIADAKRHFNVDARRVVLGGFSSGGDLAYRMMYENANLFAGLLAEGSSPFAGTGCPSRQTCIEQAAWRFNVVHVSHLNDIAYPPATVRPEVAALRDAGFPITLVERPGDHYEPDAGDTGTVHDLRTYLLPHLDDPWLAPAG